MSDWRQHRSASEERIGRAVTRLAAARGGKLDSVMSDVYVDRLQRFDASLVERACDTWCDVPRREYEAVLPEVGRLIETIERLQREDEQRAADARLLPMPKARHDEPTFFCPTCLDGFWETVWCPGSGHLRNTEKHPRHHGLPSVQCQHPRPHVAHTAAIRCECVDTNPVIAEQRNKHRQFIDAKRDAAKGRAS